MKKVISIAGELKDQENVVLFSSIVQRISSEPKPQRAAIAEGGGGTVSAQLEAARAWTRGEAVVYCLIPVLHLAQEDKVHAWQDDTFGEIFVKLN